MYFTDHEYKELYGHVLDECYELDSAHHKQDGEAILEEGWDVIFMVYGYMRGTASKYEVDKALGKVITKNSEKIKGWNKRDKS